MAFKELFVLAKNVFRHYEENDMLEAKDVKRRLEAEVLALEEDFDLPPATALRRAYSLSSTSCVCMLMARS